MLHVHWMTMLGSGLCLDVAQGGVGRHQVKVFADRCCAFKIPHMAGKHAVEDDVGFGSLLRGDQSRVSRLNSACTAQTADGAAQQN